MYWRAFWDFVRRNILTIVILAVVAVALPWTLVFIIPLAFIVLRFQMMVWKMQGTHQNTHHRSNRTAGSESRGQNRPGKVTIIRTEHTEQRVNDNVGEYVDFKEIKEDETK